MHNPFWRYTGIILTIGSLVTACSQAASGVSEPTVITSNIAIPVFNLPVTPTSIAIATSEPAVGTPFDVTPWPLVVQMRTRNILNEQSSASSEQLLKLKPGVSTLEDVYDILGYPSHRRDFPEGVVLGYEAARTFKYSHTILVDGTSGTVLLVTIVGSPEDKLFPSLEDLRAQYGEPVLAVTNYSWKHLLFETKDVAVLGGLTQLLPPGTTLQEYQAQNGYFWISLAFTP